MKRMLYILLILLAMLFVNAFTVHAHCPLCTGAVGMAAVSAKYYGMDTSIIGLLIGAFGISTGLWVGRKIKKQYFPFQTTAITLLSFILTVVPLRFIGGDNIYFPMMWFGEPGSMFNKIYWTDRIVFGSIIGGILTLLSFWLHTYIKKVTGSVLFPFQGIVITLVTLAITGGVFYFIFR